MITTVADHVGIA